MKTAEEILYSHAKERHRCDWRLLVAYGDMDTNAVVISSMESYASQFRTIERLIERGIWLEIIAEKFDNWRYHVKQHVEENIYVGDELSIEKGTLHTIKVNSNFPSYPAALADAVEYLRPLGYLEGI